MTVLLYLSMRVNCIQTQSEVISDYEEETAAKRKDSAGRGS